MVALGLVPELTAKAAKMAASSAGAKVVKTYSFEISQAEQQEIYDINPDLVLLCGGTDGATKTSFLPMPNGCAPSTAIFPLLQQATRPLLTSSTKYSRPRTKKKCVITENVMPQFNVININPAKQKIKELFISRIIEGQKGFQGFRK